MRAKYCKRLNTYTTEDCKLCDCGIWRQGVGSLVGQSTSNVVKPSTSKSTSSVSTDE